MGSDELASLIFSFGLGFILGDIAYDIDELKEEKEEADDNRRQ